MTRRFSPPGSVELRPGLRVLSRGGAECFFVRAEYEPGGTYGPHFFPEYVFFAVLEGEAVVEVAGRTWAVRAGEGMVLPPRRRAFFQFSRERQTLHICCMIQPGVFRRAERTALQGLTGIYPVSAGVHALFDEGLVLPTQGRRYEAALANLGCATLLRFAGDSLDGTGRRQAAHPALVRAVEWLRRSAAEFRTARELADRSGVSFSRLRQLFEQAGFPSPSALLWREKTEHAIRLLRSTGLTLGEVAQQAGFANPFHLSRCVKRVTGLPPKELRRSDQPGGPRGQNSGSRDRRGAGRMPR